MLIGFLCTRTGSMPKQLRHLGPTGKRDCRWFGQNLISTSIGSRASVVANEVLKVFVIV